MIIMYLLEKNDIDFIILLSYFDDMPIVGKNILQTGKLKK